MLQSSTSICKIDIYYYQIWKSEKEDSIFEAVKDDFKKRFKPINTNNLFISIKILVLNKTSQIN